MNRYQPIRMLGLAREEHALLLRCEGLMFREIGVRLGVSVERARHLVFYGARRLTRASIKCRVTIVPRKSDEAAA